MSEPSPEYLAALTLQRDVIDPQVMRTEQLARMPIPAVLKRQLAAETKLLAKFTAVCGRVIAKHQGGA